MKTLERIARTLALLLLAPILFLWATGLHLAVIVGVTARGIGKVWR